MIIEMCSLLATRECLCVRVCDFICVLLGALFVDSTFPMHNARSLPLPSRN